VIVICLFVVVGASSIVAIEQGNVAGDEANAQAKSRTTLLPLKVVQKQLCDSQDKRARLRGVNAACLEWSSNGEGHILSTVKTAIEDWHVNIIRLPLSQDRWFGKSPEQKDGGNSYRALVNQIVDTCSAKECYIILDLHWSDMNEWGKQIGQHVMPDQNSLIFWRDVASIYKNHPAVVFDLYNEPHDVSWEVWRSGGKVAEGDRRTRQEKTFEAVGMQKLLDTVRDTGAGNLIIAGGLDWAYDLSGFHKGSRLDDPKGNGVIYANHYYPHKREPVAQWVAKIEAATREFPVIVSEFGSETRRGHASEEAWLRQVLQALEDHEWNWTAWDLHPQASPCLISDWKYTPTPGFGVWVKQALLGNLPRYQPTSTPLPPTQRQ
jgi:hypothetical protein